MRTQSSSAPVTLQDVAREAGVSLATASRSLNGSDRKVADAYRERVLAAAARLQYTPNTSAQAVVRGATSTVALLVSDIADPYFSSIAAGVIHTAEAEGLIVTMAVTERDSVKELALVRALRGQRPRVMVLAGSRFEGAAAQSALVAELEAFERTGGRVVLISQARLPFATVMIDNRGGARALADRLVDHGYRRFAVVAGVGALLTSSDRLDGFLDGLAARGVAVRPDRIVRAEFTRDGGYDAALALLAAETGTAADDAIEVVFAVNDVMAVGASSALRARVGGLRAPIAVAGFDDIPLAQDVTPALTTVRIPLEAVGRRAIELALQDRDPGAHAPTVRIDTDVVLRQSTPALPAAGGSG